MDRAKPQGTANALRSYVYPAGTEVVYTDGTFAAPPAPIGSLSYRTAPAPEDLAIMGAPLLKLYVSAEQKDTDFMVALHDVGPDRKLMYVQRRFLRASHRKLDPERSRPHSPYMQHDRVVDLAPGDVYEIEIPFFPVGYVLRRGHALELSIMAPNAIPLPTGGSRR